MTFDDWIRIGKDIQKAYNQYDGFVILHGTDTLSYTACALSFMFENLGKPVVITGAQVSCSISTIGCIISDTFHGHFRSPCTTSNYSFQEISTSMQKLNCLNRASVSNSW